MNAPKKARLSLQEFKNLTGLPDSLLVWLLMHNKVPCEVDAGGLQVIITPATLEEVEKSLCVPWKELLQHDYRVHAEQIAQAIVEEIEPFLLEAAEIASRTKQG
jgi:hypothetical protein